MNYSPVAEERARRDEDAASPRRLRGLLRDKEENFPRYSFFFRQMQVYASEKPTLSLSAFCVHYDILPKSRQRRRSTTVTTFDANVAIVASVSARGNDVATPIFTTLIFCTSASVLLMEDPRVSFSHLGDRVLLSSLALVPLFPSVRASRRPPYVYVRETAFMSARMTPRALFRSANCNARICSAVFRQKK